MLITPIIISFFLYYMIRPVVRWLGKYKIHRGLMVLAVILGFAFILVIFIAYGGNTLMNQFQNEFLALLDKNIDIKGFLDDILDFIPDGIIPDDINITKEIINRFRSLLLDLSKKLLGYVGRIGDIGTQIVLVPFILFYLLKDDRLFYNKFISFMPKAYI